MFGGVHIKRTAQKVLRNRLEDSG